ncbi:hypothetical protein [Ruminococcus sp.]|uniref:hypothetical protein n=1 Tax=Ruminococcus sp. TaxID=41978 RepID=UPI001B6A2C63|nr:hypothetical protein [Ruminococcus sp.]MBP5433751.1 hypothetical protein [Ruminococcus sp.]
MRNNDFAETKRRFEAVTPDVEYPLSYAEWVKLPEKYKASALFVTFYPQIVSAAGRIPYGIISDMDLISSVEMVFLQKLEYIEADPKRYTPAYIYTMVYNAMLTTLRVNYQRTVFDQDFPYEIPSAKDPTHVVDIRELTPDNYDPVLSAAEEAIGEKMLEIEISNKDLRVAMRYAMGNQKKLGKAYKYKYPALLAQLRSIFKEYRYVYNIRLDCDTFTDVINNEELIEYAVVLLPNGEKGVYEGIKTILRNGVIQYHFSTQTQEDIVIPASKAACLKVLHTEPMED